ncbi:unnamed protein product [Closterium sp. NIES-54]
MPGVCHSRVCRWPNPPMMASPACASTPRPTSSLPRHGTTRAIEPARPWLPVSPFFPLSLHSPPSPRLLAARHQVRCWEIQGNGASVPKSSLPPLIIPLLVSTRVYPLFLPPPTRCGAGRSRAMEPACPSLPFAPSLPHHPTHSLLSAPPSPLASAPTRCGAGRSRATEPACPRQEQHMINL